VLIEGRINLESMGSWSGMRWEIECAMGGSKCVADALVGEGIRVRNIDISRSEEEDDFVADDQHGMSSCSCPFGSETGKGEAESDCFWEGDSATAALSSWVLICASRFFLEPKVDLQMVHLYTFWAKWAIWWSFRTWLYPKLLPQMSQL